VGVLKQIKKGGFLKKVEKINCVNNVFRDINLIIIRAMSNSATSAAKRRRAAPFMSNPLAPSSGNNNSQQQASFQNTQQGQSEPKLLTLQQVIALVDSRLTNLEKNVVEIKSQPSSENPEQQSDAIPEYNNEDIKQTVESIMYEYLNEFNERCEILANEISSVKNIVIELQSYTMNVNRMLLEEKMNAQLSTVDNVSLTNETQTIAITAENHSQTDNIDQNSIENLAPIESSENTLEYPSVLSENDNGVELCEIVKEDDATLPEEQSDITIVSKSSKKRGANKKSQITLEQE